MKKITAILLLAITSLSAFANGKPAEQQVKPVLNACYSSTDKSGDEVLGVVTILENGQIQHVQLKKASRFVPVEVGVMTYYSEARDSVELRANFASNTGGSYNTFITITPETVFFHKFPNPYPHERPFKAVPCPR